MSQKAISSHARQASGRLPTGTMRDNEAGPARPRVPVFWEAWSLIREISPGIFKDHFLMKSWPAVPHILRESTSCAGVPGNGGTASRWGTFPSAAQRVPAAPSRPLRPGAPAGLRPPRQPSPCPSPDGSVPSSPSLRPERRPGRGEPRAAVMRKGKNIIVTLVVTRELPPLSRPPFSRKPGQRPGFISLPGHGTAGGCSLGSGLAWGREGGVGDRNVALGMGMW